MIFNVPNLAQTESVFVLRDTACISEVFSIKGREAEAGFDISLQTVLHFITIGEGWWAVYDFKTGTGGWSILAAGKSVFYTDLPDLEACILLFGLFFNQLWDWGVYDLPGQGVPGEWETGG